MTLEDSERSWRERVSREPAYEMTNVTIAEHIRTEIYLYEDAHFLAQLDHAIYGRPGLVLPE